MLRAYLSLDLIDMNIILYFLKILNFNFKKYKILKIYIYFKINVKNIFYY